MGLFSFLRRKSADDLLMEHAERVRKLLFPNGHADLAWPGIKIKLIMGEKFTQPECEAYYAAMATWLAMSPNAPHERALKKFVDAAGGKITIEQALEVSLVLCKEDDQLFSINPGHVPDKAIELGTAIPAQRTERILKMLEEIFGRPQFDFLIEREAIVTWKGRTLKALVVFSTKGPEGARHRIFFA